MAILQRAIRQHAQVERAPNAALVPTPQIVSAGHKNLIISKALKLFGRVNSKCKQVQPTLACMHYSYACVKVLHLLKSIGQQHHTGN